MNGLDVTWQLKARPPDI